MDKIYNYKENLPTIYSQNITHLKSLSPNKKNKLLNSLEYSLANSKNKIRYNSLTNEKINFNINNEISNHYLKLSNINDNKDDINFFNKDIVLTNYNSINNSIFRKSKVNDMLKKIKLKNNNIHVFNLTKKQENKSNNLFSNSYYNFLNNLKKKRESLNNIIKIENNQKEKINEYNNKDIQLSSSNAINNIINIKNQSISPEDDNKKINLEILSPIKSLDIKNKNISIKTPNRLSLSTNNTIHNNFSMSNTNRNNVFGISNDKYTAYTNNINNNITNNNFTNKKICPLCNKDVDFYRYRSHINIHPSKIFNWLYLGSFRNACNIKDLKDLKINYILNCAVECENKNLPADINCYHAKINDSPYFQLHTFFDKTNFFINKAKMSGGNILIHCQLGISRSTSCLIAYMIKYLGYTTLTALQYIKKKRPIVMPNFGFIQQLKNYENKININQKKLETENENEINKKNAKKEQNFESFIKLSFF